MPYLLKFPLIMWRLLKKVAFAESEPKIKDSSLLFTEENRSQCDISSPFSSIVLDNERTDEDDGFTDSMTSQRTTSDSSEFKGFLSVR